MEFNPEYFEWMIIWERIFGIVLERKRLGVKRKLLV